MKKYADKMKHISVGVSCHCATIWLIIWIVATISSCHSHPQRTGLANDTESLKQVLRMNDIQTDTALTAVEALLDNASKKNDSAFLGNVYNTKAIVLMRRNRYHDALTLLKSAIAIHTRQKDTISLAYDYLQMGKNLLVIGMPDSVLHYQRRALSFFEKWGNENDIASAHYLLGLSLLTFQNDSEAWTQIQLSKQLSTKIHDSSAVYLCNLAIASFVGTKVSYSEAFAAVNEVVSFGKRTGNHFIVAYGLLRKAAIFNQASDFSNAVKYALASLRIQESSGFIDIQERTLAVIARYHIYLNDSGRVAQYLQRANALSKASGNEQNQEFIKNINAGLYEMYGDTIAALRCYEDALTIALKNGNIGDIFSGYSNVAGWQVRYGSKITALKYYLESLRYCTNNVKNTTLTYAFIASCISNMSPEELLRVKIAPHKADAIIIKYFNDADSLIKVSKGTATTRRYVYGQMGIYFKQTKQWKEAYQYERIALAAKDEIFEGQKTAAIEGLHMQYETEKKEQQLVQLKKDKLIAIKEVKAQKLMRNTLVVISILLLTIAALLFSRYRLKRRIELERIRSHISRDLHDDIGSTLSSINILSSMAQHNKSDIQTDALQKISERSQRLLTNMSDIIWSVKPENDTLKEILSRMRMYATGILEAQGIDYTIDFPQNDEGIIIPLDIKTNLYLIFKEAVNNMAKYSKCTHAHLSVQLNNRQLQLMVRDDGIGFNLSVIQEEDSLNGNGLLNMKKRAEEMGATLKIESSMGRGTIVALSLPIQVK